MTLRKAVTVVVLSSVLLSVLLTTATMYLIMGTIEPAGIGLAVAIPVMVSWPVSYVVYSKNQALRRALAQLEQANAKLLQLYKKTKRQARHDLMTGCLNRARFIERLSKELNVEDGDKTGGVLIMLDVDDLKLINDTFGHGVGDQALIEFARLLQGKGGKGRFSGRLGGDEFALFQNLQSKQLARELAENLCRKAAQILPDTQHDAGAKMSVSVGMIMVQPGDEAHQVMGKCDRAMYLAKHSGGNQVQDFAALATNLTVTADKHRLFDSFS